MGELASFFLYSFLFYGKNFNQLSLLPQMLNVVAERGGGLLRGPGGMATQTVREVVDLFSYNQA